MGTGGAAVNRFPSCIGFGLAAQPGGHLRTDERGQCPGSRETGQQVGPLAGVEHPGQVLEVELERKAAAGSGRWVYEIKLLQPSGGLLKLEVDAASARVLKARARRPEGR